MRQTDRLVYVPLGGSGEIGMNMYLYGFGPPGKENFIMVDAGVAFPDMATSPGVNLILPDDSFIRERLNQLLENPKIQLLNDLRGLIQINQALNEQKHFPLKIIP